jgi:hypothetical protein
MSALPLPPGTLAGALAGVVAGWTADDWGAGGAELVAGADPVALTDAGGVAAVPLCVRALIR